MPSDPSGSTTLAKALTAVERQQITDRLAVLRLALAYRNDDEARATVIGLMASFPSARMADDDARLTVSAYVVAMRDLPPWAVTEAARRWTRGQGAGGNKAFPPSSAELYEAADGLTDAYRYEAAMLERMLAAKTAEPIPTMSRERRAEIAADVQRAVAKAGLEQKAAALGLDPDAALAEVEDARPFDPMRKVGEIPMEG